MTLEANKARAKTFMDGLGAGRFPDNLLSDDFAAWTILSGDLPGERYRGAVAMLASVFQAPVKIDIQTLTAEDDRVVVQSRSEGTLVDGTVYRNDYVFVLTFAGGRIAKAQEYFNTATVREVLAPVMQAAAARAAEQK